MNKTIRKIVLLLSFKFFNIIDAVASVRYKNFKVLAVVLET